MKGHKHRNVYLGRVEWREKKNGGRMIRQNPYSKYLCYAIKIISFSFGKSMIFVSVWVSVRMLFSWLPLALFHHFSSNIHEMPLSIIFQLFYLPMINSFFDADVVVVCRSHFFLSYSLNLCLCLHVILVPFFFILKRYSSFCLYIMQKRATNVLWIFHFLFVCVCVSSYVYFWKHSERCETQWITINMVDCCKANCSVSRAQSSYSNMPYSYLSLACNPKWAKTQRYQR